MAGRSFDAFETVVVQIEHAGFVGQGEAVPVFYLGETPQNTMERVESLRDALASSIDRQTLLGLLPACSARNAIDCALWELEAKSRRSSVWALSGAQPKELETQLTIGIEATPAEMARQAQAAGAYRLIKIKLDAEQPLERVQAIRHARPDARIVVDANQAWSPELLRDMAPRMAELQVHMIEQPLPRGADETLEKYRSPVPLCADESFLTADDLDTVARRYQLVNIKLDKVGGLTSGLALAHAAHARGLGVAVGCMGGSSLSMAPAVVLACIAEITDLDGPLWLRSDRLPSLQYHRGRIASFGPEVWG